MSLPGESANSPIVNPFDQWSQPEHADRQEATVQLIERRNPEFMATMREWADLLTNGTLPAYEDRPRVIAIASGIDYTSTYEPPSGGYHGFTEIEAETDPAKRKPNTAIYMALDAIVKAHNPSAFIAPAKPGVFDPYIDVEHYVEYYVLGNRQNTHTDPGVDADRALAVHYTHPVLGELVPRYSAEGHAARVAAKAALAESHKRAARIQSDARELGASAVRLAVQRAVTRLAEELEATDNDTALSVRAFMHVPDPKRTGQYITPTFSQLSEYGDTKGANIADVANAFARLHPDETAEELLARMLEQPPDNPVD